MEGGTLRSTRCFIGQLAGIISRCRPAAWTGKPVCSLRSALLHGHDSKRVQPYLAAACAAAASCAGSNSARNRWMFASAAASASFAASASLPDSRRTRSARCLASSSCRCRSYCDVKSHMIKNTLCCTALAGSRRFSGSCARHGACDRPAAAAGRAAGRRGGVVEYFIS